MRKAITGLSAKASTGLLAMTLGLALASCGGGSDESTPQTVSGTISGVAATGAAISGGLVTLKCASGLSSVTTSTAVDGSYSFNVDKVVLPCLAQVSYTDAGGDTQTLHAYVGGTGTTNITPLTDLLLATLLSTPSLAPAFASFHNTPLRTFSSTEQSNAIALIATRLQEIGINLPEGIDPAHNLLIAKTLSQEGNAHDQILDELNHTMQNLGADQYQLGLVIILGLSTDEALHYSPDMPTDLPALSESLADYDMAGLHTGTLPTSGRTCSFSVSSEGNINADFAPASMPRSLDARSSPTADGLSISLGNPLSGLNIVYLEHGPQQPYTWNFLNSGINAANSSFFEMTGRSGALMAVLRYTVREVPPANPGGAVQYFRQRKLEIIAPVTSLSQDGSVTCVTAEQSFIPD